MRPSDRAERGNRARRAAGKGFDMSQFEKYSWASLITLGAIYAWFAHRMLDGWSVVDQPAKELFFVYIAVVVLSIIAESVIAGVLAAQNARRGGKRDIDKDERDLAVEAKASRNEHCFLLVAINVVVFHILADAAFANHVFPRIDLTDIATLFFVLFTILFAGEAIKRISTIVYYRA